MTYRRFNEKELLKRGPVKTVGDLKDFLKTVPDDYEVHGWSPFVGGAEDDQLCYSGTVMPNVCEEAKELEILQWFIEEEEDNG
jgi:hypothetical protein